MQQIISTLMINTNINNESDEVNGRKDIVEFTDDDADTEITSDNEYSESDNSDEDEPVNATGDVEIDTIRNEFSKTLSIVLTNKDIMKSDKSIKIHDTFSEIYGKTIDRLTTFKTIDYSIQSYINIKKNNFDFSTIVDLPNKPDFTSVIKSNNFPTISATSTNLKPINFDKSMRDAIANCNIIIDKINTASWTNFTNNVIVKLTSAFNQIISIEDFLDDHLFTGDYKKIRSIDSEDDYFKIYNYESNMLGFSNAYRIFELNEILFSLNELVRIKIPNFDILQSTRNVSKLKHIHSLLKSSNKQLLPKSIMNIFNKLEQSEVFTRDLEPIAVLLESINDLEDHIKFLATGAGIISIKRSKITDKTILGIANYVISNYIENHNSDSLQDLIDKLKALFDHNFLQLKPQYGMFIEKINLQ